MAGQEGTRLSARPPRRLKLGAGPGAALSPRALAVQSARLLLKLVAEPLGPLEPGGSFAPRAGKRPGPAPHPVPFPREGQWPIRVSCCARPRELKLQSAQSTVDARGQNLGWEAAVRGATRHGRIGLAAFGKQTVAIGQASISMETLRVMCHSYMAGKSDTWHNSMTSPGNMCTLISRACLTPNQRKAPWALCVLMSRLLRLALLLTSNGLWMVCRSTARMRTWKLTSKNTLTDKTYQAAEGERGGVVEGAEEASSGRGK